MNTGKWIRFGRHYYEAWGLAILNFVVPAAVTAGLLAALVHTVDKGVNFSWKFDYGLVFGWFRALLFVISTGHGEKPGDPRGLLSTFFDLFETFSMVMAFHILGLVQGANTRTPGADFFCWVAAYLISIEIRRHLGLWRRAAQETRVSADDWIDWLRRGGIMVCLAAALLHATAADGLDVNACAAWLLWIALVAYLCFVVRRQKELARSGPPSP